MWSSKIHAAKGALTHGTYARTSAPTGVCARNSTFGRAWRFCFMVATFLTGCTTTTQSGVVGVNRSQLMTLSAAKVEAMSLTGFDELKAHAIEKGILDLDTSQTKRVQSIVARLVPQTSAFRADAPQWPWESHVIASTEVNAFCMPGGKIIVYSGFLKKIAPSDAQLAAVLGHEISHALREHGRERLSRDTAQNGLLELLFGINKWDPAYAGAANQFAHILIGLNYDRTQETEADEMGLELMARAGFDPKEAVTLWKKMGELGTSDMPEFLSDHPSDQHREQRLEKLLPKVEPLFNEAQRNLTPTSF